MCSKFLSTPSARRATGALQVRQPGHDISIHALCEEGDRVVLIINQFVIISIHALCEEGDPRPQRLRGHQRAISIHALCEEGDAQNRQRFYAFN